MNWAWAPYAGGGKTVERAYIVYEDDGNAWSQKCCLVENLSRPRESSLMPTCAKHRHTEGNHLWVALQLCRDAYINGQFTRIKGLPLTMESILGLCVGKIAWYPSVDTRFASGVVI